MHRFFKRSTLVLMLAMMGVQAISAESLNQIFEKIQPSQGAGDAPEKPAIKPDEKNKYFDRVGLEKFVKTKLEEHIGGPVDMVIDATSYEVGPCQNFSPSYVIQKLSLNDSQTHFSAEVKVCSDPKAENLLLAGTLEPTLDIPVLNKPIHAGDIIHKEDIKSTKLSSKSLPKGVLRNAEDLIGAKPRAGMLKSNVPLKESDLDRPKDVKKGALVTVNFKSENMEMQTKGKAVEGGMIGDTISVMNVDSHKTVKATIDGPNHATLTPNYTEDFDEGEIQ